MCKYYIGKTEIGASLHSDVWDDCESAEVACPNWKNWRYAPKTFCKMLEDDTGLYIRFTTDEEPYSVYENFNDPTNRDSCVELFINFSPENTGNYMNFEINSKGVMSLGFGSSIQNRKQIADVDFSIFRIMAEEKQNGWEVFFYIPFSFVKKYYAGVSGTFAGNLYKCGDRTPKPHYVSWAPIRTEVPNFHLSEYFGEFRRTVNCDEEV